MTPTKTIPIVATSIISIPGVYLVVQLSSVEEGALTQEISQQKEPTIVTINSSTSELNEYKSKFGATYANYFLATVEGADKALWDAKIKKINQEKGSLKNDGFFKDLISKEISEQDLKNKCKEAYGTQENNDGTEDKKWGEVWNYCSLFKVKPTLLKDLKGGTTYQNNTYGTTGKQQLVAETSGMNTDFWNAQHKRYSSFKNSGEEIRKWCEEAYKKTSSDETYNDKTIYEYCSLEGKKNS